MKKPRKVRKPTTVIVFNNESKIYLGEEIVLEKLRGLRIDTVILIDSEQKKG